MTNVEMETIFGDRWDTRELADFHPFSSTDPIRWDTAREAVAETAPFELGLYPLVAYRGRDADTSKGGPGRYFETDLFAILKEENGGPAELWGKVTSDYHMLQPADVAGLWDEHVAQPVTSSSIIDRRLVIATTLPSIDIGRDTVANYFYVINPMDGLRAANYLVSSVKIVCRNTLLMAIASAAQNFRVVHETRYSERFAAWLGQAWEKANLSIPKTEKTFKALAKRRLTAQETGRVLAASYPYPNEPRTTAPDDVMKDRKKRWVYLKGRVDEYRGAARFLFDGAGTGFDDPAMQGTAWGLVNAVAETEDWRQTKDEDDLDGITDSILFGERAATKRRAMVAATRLLKAA
jgi:hypothetical protein